jgi:hypothetical protein
MSLGDPFGPLGPPYNDPIGQQLATVDNLDVEKLPSHSRSDLSVNHLESKSIASERPILITDSLSGLVRDAIERIRSHKEDREMRARLAQYLGQSSARL